MTSINSATIHPSLHDAFMLMNSDVTNTKFYKRVSSFCSGKSEARKQSNFTVYILGADRESACKIEGELIRKGYVTRNPLRLMTDKMKPQEYLRESMKLLLECNSIYLCPHISENDSLKLQYQVANTLGLKIFNTDVIIDTENNNNNL
jgi:hypothetical protein